MILQDPNVIFDCMNLYKNLGDKTLNSEIWLSRNHINLFSFIFFNLNFFYTYY